MALGSLKAAGQIRAPSGPAVRPVAFSRLEGGFQCVPFPQLFFHEKTCREIVTEQEEVG